MKSNKGISFPAFLNKSDFARKLGVRRGNFSNYLSGFVRIPGKYIDPSIDYLQEMKGEIDEVIKEFKELRE